MSGPQPLPVQYTFTGFLTTFNIEFDEDIAVAKSLKLPVNWSTKSGLPVAPSILL